MSTETDRSDVQVIEEIDWESMEGGQLIATRQDAVMYGSVLLYVALWVYHHLFVGEREALLSVDQNLLLFELTFDLDPSNVNWLFGLTLLIGFWTVVVPLVQNPRMTRYYWKQFKRNKAAVLSLFFLAFVFVLGVFGPILLGRPDPNWGAGHVPPIGFGGTWEHPFGTNRRGEDILLIVVSGARVSMQVGLIATMVSIALATLVATVAAFSGGWVDEVLMRFVDLLLTFPTFFLILFLVFIYGGNLFLLILILSLTGWGGQARLIRSEALQRTEEAYIRAAEAAGASRWYIIRRHIIPNVSNTVITAATLLIPILILFEAVIAFLGFGDPGVWSWGRIIADGRNVMRSAWWVATIPGLFLFFTVLAFNFLGDALRDALDPRHEAHER